jgi:triphosphatase
MEVVREMEWQFDAVDLRPVMRWLDEPARQAEDGAVRVEPGDNTSHADTYLDTDDRRFHRAGYSLRIRRTGRSRSAGAEATLKEIESATTGQRGLRSRREISEQLQKAHPGLLERSDGPVGERVRARVTGKSWKSFVKLIEAERPTPAAPATSSSPPAGSRAE